MKFITLVLLIILTNNFTIAQSRERDWYKDNQPYVKIEVNKTGVYELQMEEVGKLIPGVFNVSAKKLRLYHRGENIAFDITSKSGLLQKEDRLYFFAEKNDGKYESEFYVPSSAQPNSFSSLYTNVSVYYLTISSEEKDDQFISLEGTLEDLKLIEQPYVNSFSPKNQPYQSLQIYSSEFTFNSVTGPIPYVQHSYFEPGEGYTGSLFKEKVIYELEVPLTYRTSEELITEIQINGRDNNFIKELNLKYGNIDTNIVINEFYAKTITLKQKIKNLSESPVIKIYGDGGAYSVSYIKSNYTRNLIFNNNSGYTYINQKSKAGIQVINPSGQIFRVWNITDKSKITEAYDLGFNEYLIDTKKDQNLYYYFSEYQKAISLSLFQSNKALLSNKADYIIISSKRLVESARKYAEFRSSDIGGNYQVELVFVEDLYDQFNYGIKTPMAIKNFIKFKLNTTAPKYLLLIGKAFSAYTGINSSDDLVPSYGYPASDILLSSGITTNFDVPAIPTGRIPALTNEEVLLYIDKLKQKLNLDLDLTQKNMIHLNGGSSFSQIESWSAHMKDLSLIAQNSSYGVNITSKKKQILDPKEPADIVKNLNEGVSLISFLGHSSYQLIDLNIDFVSNPVLGYNNKRYPVLFMNGCAFNNYYREIPTLSKDWLFTPNKGAIATIGQSYFGYPIALTKHAEIFYDVVFNSEAEPSIGQAMKMTAQRISLATSKNEYDVLNSHQTLIYGDPAIKIFNYSEPDFKIENAEYKESNNNSLILRLSNQGKIVQNKKLPIYVVLKNSFSKDTIKFEALPPYYIDTLTLPLKTSTFISEIEIILDPKNTFAEFNENNNRLTIKMNEPPTLGDKLPPSALVLIQDQNPFNNMKVASNVNFKINLIDDQILNYSNNPNKYFTIYFKNLCDTCNYKKISFDKHPFQVKNINKKIIELNLLLENLVAGNYEIVIIVQDESGNSTRENPYILTFQISPITSLEDNTKLKFSVYPNPSFGCVNFESDHQTDNPISYAIYNGTTGALVSKWIENKNEKNTWCPQTPGTYHYNIVELKKNKKQKLASGKLIIF
jgi:hypothetical protein